MKHYRIEFSVLDKSGNWQLVADNLFEARHHKRAEEIAENSRWAAELRKKHAGRECYIGWRGED